MPNTAQPGFDTLCIHGGHQPQSQRAHLTPLFASSTYTFDSAAQAEAVFQGHESAYIYGRFGSPTIREAEEKIALLEGFGLGLPIDALLHASGMAAITTLLLANLCAGDKIITHQSLYGGTQEMLDKILPGLGIEAIIADFDNFPAVERQIQSDTSIRMMYLETPANPTLRCIDLKAYVALGKQQGLIVCADNTFATPFLQQPFRYGLDYVLHSTTKFLNGHGTAIGGVLLFRNDLETAQKQKLIKTHRLLGGNSNAFDAFLLTNGLRTLGLRMERHCANACAVAEFLEKQEQVIRVNFPGLKSHPHYELAQAQMKRPAPVMSFELQGGIEAGRQFMDALQLCSNAVSLGTADTILSHPASTTHVGVPREARLVSGISDGLIRMSVGMENIEDLIADLKQALERATL